MTAIKYLDIRWVTFKGEHHQISGRHPALVIQNNVGNRCSTNVQVIPISSARKTKMPTHVFLPTTIGLMKNSYAQCESVTCVDKSYIGDLITTLPQEMIAQIARATLINIPLIGLCNQSEMSEIWNDITASYRRTCAS